MKNSIFTLLKNYKNTTPFINEQAGSLDRKRHRMIVNKIVASKNDWGTEQEAFSKISMLHECVYDILSIAQYDFYQQPRSNVRGVVNACMQQEQPIEFVTIASGAVTSGIFNQELALMRVQYQLYDVVHEILMNVPSLKLRPWRYTVLLPLISQDDTQKDSWGVNKSYIEARTKVPVLHYNNFFSEFEQFPNLLPDELSVIKNKTNRILEHQNIKMQFAVSEEKIVNDIRDYAIYGKYFEASKKPIILIDLQRKIYPYQQPCYRLIRKTPFAILPMHDLVIMKEKENSLMSSGTNA